MIDKIKRYLSTIGKRGGAAGNGAAKARDPEVARAAANARWGKAERKEKRSGTSPAAREQERQKRARRNNRSK